MNNNDKFIIIFIFITLLGFSGFLLIYGIQGGSQKQSFISCIFEKCKINILDGKRTCSDKIIEYDPTKEVCTNEKQCPSSFPCVDNGKWIDCSTNICPIENPNCNCYNFGQCASNISMAWKLEKDKYYNFSTGTVNNKKYGIPIFPYTDYKNNIISCRLNIELEKNINYTLCTAGNYVKDEKNGYICCSYNDTCQYA